MINILLIFLIFFYNIFISCDATCKKKNPIDLMLLVDATPSMRDDMATLQTAIPELMLKLKQFNSQSRFGLVTFNWKPNTCSDFIPENYCARIDLPLTIDDTTISEALQKIQVAGGSPNGQQDALGAMLIAALNIGVGWRDEHSTDNIKPIRVMVVLTDDVPSYPNLEKRCSSNEDYIRGSSIDFPPNNGDGSYECDKEDFPSVGQVSAAIQLKKIEPFFLVTKPRIPHYEWLADQLGFRERIRPLRADSSNIVDLILSSLEDISCPTTMTPESQSTTFFKSTRPQTTLFKRLTTRVSTTHTRINIVTEGKTETQPETSASTTLEENKDLTGLLIGGAGAVFFAIGLVFLAKHFLIQPQPLHMEAIFEDDELHTKEIDKNLAVHLSEDVFA